MLTRKALVLYDGTFRLRKLAFLGPVYNKVEVCLPYEHGIKHQWVQELTDPG